MNRNLGEIRRSNNESNEGKFSGNSGNLKPLDTDKIFFVSQELASKSHTIMSVRNLQKSQENLLSKSVHEQEVEM